MQRFALTCLILAAITMTSPASSAADPIVIRLATIAPEGTPYYNYLKKMGHLWKKHSNGQVVLKIVPSGVAGSEKAVVRKIKLGTLQAAMVTGGGLAAIDQAIHAMQIPLGFDSKAEFDYVMGKMAPVLERIYASKGFKILFWAEAGWVRFFSKKPIVTPADVQSEKVFIFAGEPKQVRVWKSAGFNVVPLSETEITTSLQSGLITVVPTTAQAAKVMGWYKHVPHMMDKGFTPLLGAAVIDQRVWDRIDGEVRKKLLKIARLAGRKLLAKSRPDEETSVRDMVARGLKVHAVSAESMVKWRALIAKAKNVIRGVFAPAGLYDQVIGHRDAFRAKNR